MIRFFLFFLLIVMGLLLLSQAEGPLYSHSDPREQLEFDNVYQDLRNARSSVTNLLNSTNTWTASNAFLSTLMVGTTHTKERTVIVDNTSGNTSVGSNPILWLGGGNTNNNTLSEIGFTYGFTGTYTETYAPVTFGYQLTSGSGFTKGDLVFTTRNVTTDTQPTERMRITAAGAVTIPNTNLQIGGNQVYPLLQTAQGLLTISSATTSTTFRPTGLKTTLTPKFNTDIIKITVSATLAASNTTTMAAEATIERNGTNLAGATGFAIVNGNQTTALEVPMSISYYDSPASVSALTYEVYTRTTGTGTATLNNSNQTCVIILEEVAQ